MLTKTKIQDIAGKTVSRVHFQDSFLVLVFTDDTYADLELQQDRYEESSSMVNGQEIRLIPDEYGRTHHEWGHVQAGVITAEERQQSLDLRKEFMKKQADEQEWNKFRELQKKFAGRESSDLEKAVDTYHGR
jgi:hypothetical protein